MRFLHAFEKIARGDGNHSGCQFGLGDKHTPQHAVIFGDENGPLVRRKMDAVVNGLKSGTLAKVSFAAGRVCLPALNVIEESFGADGMHLL